MGPHAVLSVFCRVSSVISILREEDAEGAKHATRKCGADVSVQLLGAELPFFPPEPVGYQAVGRERGDDVETSKAEARPMALTLWSVFY